MLKYSLILIDYKEEALCNKFKPAPFLEPTDSERINLAAILKSVDLCATNTRINILHYLTTSDIPLTAEMISQCVALPLSSSYRALAALEATNLTGVTFSRGGVTRWFRFNPQNQQHCPACGQNYYTEYN